MPEGICCKHTSTSATRCQCSPDYIGAKCNMLAIEQADSTPPMNRTQLIAIVGVGAFIVLTVLLSIVLIKYNQRELERVSSNASRRNTQQPTHQPTSPKLTRKDYLSPRSTYSAMSPRSSGCSLKPHLLSTANSAYFTPRESSQSDNLLRHKL